MVTNYAPVSSVSDSVTVYDGGVAGSVDTSICKPPSKRPCLKTKANARTFRIMYRAAFTSLINLQAFTMYHDGSGDTPPFFFEDTFDSTPMIKKTFARVFSNNRGLIDLVLYLLAQRGQTMAGIDMCGIECFPETIDHQSIPASPHIEGRQYHRGPSYFLPPPRHSVAPDLHFKLYDTSSGFWIELTRQKIYILCITLKSYSVPPVVIDYLVSN
ncbi:hypothetical protein ARMGADRAFT_1084552 [Armillaria gallica]|uniref:Uncharacterized protein n=1 Tax=Armillaria gallica TaxID=47427 RepID=A0A2H3D4B0_ARMGA|nr:hypothetical protein ARMGADRAFT_1084552 [Armillaria gallica]